MSKKCGKQTADGGECQRPAAWGVDGLDLGPCIDHVEQADVDGWKVPPDVIPDVAKPWWGPLVEFLDKKNVLTPGNHIMLTAALVKFGDWLRNREDVERVGLSYVDPKQGNRPAKTPYFQIDRDALQQIRRLLNALGVTTSGMSNTSFPEPEEGEPSPMERLLEEGEA